MRWSPAGARMTRRRGAGAGPERPSYVQEGQPVDATGHGVDPTPRLPELLQIPDEKPHVEAEQPDVHAPLLAEHGALQT